MMCAPGLKVARLGLCHEARPQLGGREMGRKELAGAQEGVISKQCLKD